jgi:hypothetical protein
MSKKPASSFPVYVAQLKAGRPFEWPQTQADKYYLYWPNTVAKMDPYHEGSSVLILITPNGIHNANTDEGPGQDALPTWLRVSDHVVIERPDVQHSGLAPAAFLMDLGLFVGAVNFESNPAEVLKPKEKTQWLAQYLPAFKDVAKAPRPTLENRFKVLKGWAARANWTAGGVLDVAVIALLEFHGHSHHQQLEALFKRSAAKAGRDWDAFWDITPAFDKPSLKIGKRVKNVELLRKSPEHSTTSINHTEVLPDPFLEHPITACYPVRLSTSKQVREFTWPKTVRDSFYVVKSQTKVTILVTPSCLQVFPKGYPIDIGEGFHFVRISDHVVVEMPAAIDRIACYREVIEGLGLVIARVDRAEKPLSGHYGSVRSNFNKWARKIFPLVEIVIPTHADSEYLFPEDILSVWLNHANATAPETRKVIITLAKDLAKTREWPLLARSLAPLVTNLGLNFEELAIKGKGLQIVRAQRSKAGRSPYYLGHSMPWKKAATFINRVSQGIKKAQMSLDRLSYPPWTLPKDYAIPLLKRVYKSVVHKYDLEDANRRKDPKSTPSTGMGMRVHTDLDEF